MLDVSAHEDWLSIPGDKDFLDLESFRLNFGRTGSAAVRSNDGNGAPVEEQLLSRGNGRLGGVEATFFKGGV